MKYIYTSNYARQANNPLAIGISLTVPEWYTGDRRLDLAPTSDMVFSLKRDRRGYNQRKYVRDYIDVLHERNIKPQELIDSLPDGSILLCYESPDDFCHRHLLANWVEEHTGFQILEWQNEDERLKENQNAVVDSIVSF